MLNLTLTRTLTLILSKELGFRAAKLEATLTGPYAHEGMTDPSPASVTSLVAAVRPGSRSLTPSPSPSPNASPSPSPSPSQVRQAVGPDFTLMVAVQYAYEAAEPVAAMIAEWERRHLGVLFIETPLRMDDTEQIAALGALLAERHCATQVAYGEWQATRHEFAPLLPHIGVLQPDVGRVGGLTEARRVCRIAAAHGKSVAPHCCKSGIGIAAAVHLAAAAPDVCRFVEFLPTELSSSPLRQRLTSDDEAALHSNGTLPLPRRPGLGVTVDMAALREFEGYAAAAIERGAGHGKGMAALAAPQQASGAMPVLIVGCGAAARCHVDAMRASGRFECVALADTEPAAAAALSSLVVSRGGKPPKVFETLEEALDADPEKELFRAVWVLVPNSKKLHTELAAMALDDGRHVLLEKPIARNLSEGRDLANKVNAIEQTTVRALRPRLMVAETSAFWPAVTAVGAAISRGDVGEVCMIRAKCWIPAGGAWADRYKAESWLCTGGEGGLFDAMTHWIRPLRMWFGEIEKVVCMSTEPLSRMRGPSSMQAFLRFVSGRSAVFEAVLAPHAISDQPFFQIQGDLGEIVLDGFGGGVYLYSGDASGGGPATFGTKTELCRSPWESAYEEELNVFAAAIHDGDELPSKAGADEALRDLALVRAIFESAGDDAKFGWCTVNLKLGGRLNYEDV